MPYATKQDLIDSYGADRFDLLAERDGAGTRNEAKIGRALENASAIVDGYIAARYALPLATTPATLRECCISIAVYKLATDATLLSDDVRQRYEDAIAFLKDIAKGIASLGLPAAASGSTGAASSAATQSPQTILIESSPRTFSRASLRRM